LAEKLQTISKEDLDLDKPKMYKVILLNDDFTTMDFVVEVLMKIFDKHYNEAVDIMIAVHKDGKGICGVYPFEIAEAKTAQVKKLARESGFPLKAIIEKD
jgi:ATP-dependent Clp protease adaptor protein ClpS